MADIEHDFRIEGLNKITQKEGNAKKPIYQMHKWWARRLGSVFRMLLQSSDWPFLVTTGQAREYAIVRFNEHLERFNRLAELAEAGRADPALVAELYERDKLFPDIDYRWFGDREGVSRNAKSETLARAEYLLGNGGSYIVYSAALVGCPGRGGASSFPPRG